MHLPMTVMLALTFTDVYGFLAVQMAIPAYDGEIIPNSRSTYDPVLFEPV